MTAPATPMQPGDAWRYCSNLHDPEAVKVLVQALRAVGHPAGG